MRNRITAGFLLPLLLIPRAPLVAQSNDSAPLRVHWYDLAATAGGLILLSTLDDNAQRASQAARNPGRDGVARVVRRMGQPEVYLPVALGTIAVGLISGDDDVLRSGGRIAGSLAVAGIGHSALKLFVGRHRPTFTTDQYDFKPFSSRASWPSGHSAQSFALASSVSDEIDFVPATVALYTAASLTGWSRINDNRHWLSDVVTGALIGIVSTKFVNGRWRVAGAKPPGFLQGDIRFGASIGF
jgi:membrane-associated phospholipid phosphatase